MNKKGFTFSEILISIALVALALLVLSGVIIGGLEAITKGTAYTEAATIAQSRMEKIIYAVNDNYDIVSDPANSLWQPDSPGNYDLTVTLTPGSAYSGQNYTKITVEVKNNDKNGRKGAAVALETIFVQP